MIAGLIGTIHRVEEDAVLVNVNGVIYRVYTTATVLARAHALEREQELFTHQVVREDANLLYGFLTPADAQWFDVLIGVNSIGPRMALAILSRFSADELVTIIAGEQVDLLTTVSGVGKKTASRIILDLRGKLPENLDARVSIVGASNRDAEEALLALGYNLSEARGALSKLDLEPSSTVEDQIVAALRTLGS